MICEHQAQYCSCQVREFEAEAAKLGSDLAAIYAAVGVPMEAGLTVLLHRIASYRVLARVVSEVVG